TKTKCGPAASAKRENKQKTKEKFRQLGGKRKTSSGQMRDSTSKAGSYRRRKSNREKNIRWWFSFTEGPPAPQRRNGQLRLECRERLSRLSRRAVTTFCCRIRVAATVRAKNSLAQT